MCHCPEFMVDSAPAEGGGWVSVVSCCFFQSLTESICPYVCTLVGEWLKLVSRLETQLLPVRAQEKETMQQSENQVFPRMSNKVRHVSSSDCIAVLFSEGPLCCMLCICVVRQHCSDHIHIVVCANLPSMAC